MYKEEIWLMILVAGNLITMVFEPGCVTTWWVPPHGKRARQKETREDSNLVRRGGGSLLFFVFLYTNFSEEAKPLL